LNRIHSPSQLGRRLGRQRFNMDVDEVDVVRGMMEYWRRDLHLPLRILIVWRENNSTEKKNILQGTKPRLLERWDIQFELASASLSGPNEEELLVQVRSVWKRVVILLRTLYSRMLLLPATALTQEDIYSKRSARQQKNHAEKLPSIGFAVCTRENDSDAWLLLNGHESPAYQSNPPLEFTQDAKVERFFFTPASCAFGTYSIHVHYDASVTELFINRDSSPAPTIPSDPSSTASIKEQDMRRSPSGLSILLAQEEHFAQEEDTKNEVPTNDSMGGYIKNTRLGASLSSTPEDKETISPPLLDRRTPSIESSPGSTRLARFSPRRLLHTASVTIARPPLNTTVSGRSVGSAAALPINSGKRKPPRQPGLLRHVSRSADDDPGKKFLEARAAATKKDTGWQHLNAPFGYADEDDPNLLLDPSFDDPNKKIDDTGRNSPLVFAKQAVKPLIRNPPKNSKFILPQEKHESLIDNNYAQISSCSNIPAALPPKAAAAASLTSSSSASGNGGTEMIESRSYNYGTPETPDKQLGGGPPPPFAFLGGTNNSPEDIHESRFAALLGSSPPFAATWAETAAAVWSGKKKSANSSGKNKDKSIAVQSTTNDDDSDEDSAYFLAQRQSGLPSARGALALTAESSPFLPHQTIFHAFDDFNFSALDDDNFNVQHSSDDQPFIMTPDDTLPPFAFDEDFNRMTDSNIIHSMSANTDATIVDAVIEIIHLCTDPPLLTFAKEEPLTWDLLDHDLAKCSRILENHHRYRKPFSTPTTLSQEDK